ncbi:MAG: hypothetical protein ACOYNZ_15740 [Rhodoferax sp.]
MQFILASLTPNIVCLQLSFTPEAFRQILAAWKQTGVDAYRCHFPLDFVFLICYGSIGYLLAADRSVFSRFQGRFSAQLRWLLPFAAVFDACENIAHLLMLRADAAITPMAVALSGTFSLLKWLLTIAFVAALGIALVVRKP